MPKVSAKTRSFTESVIREMTRLAGEYDAVNLAQGYPDFSCPPELKLAATAAIEEDYNQYSVTWGSEELREAVSQKLRRYNRIDAKPNENIVITCGTTEAMVASQIALLDPGDELIVISPHYENYAPDAILSGARPKYFPLDEERGYSLDEEAFKEQFNSNTKGIVINTPMNPTGKVFNEKELSLIADLCIDYDVTCFTDEIYEYILYDDARHGSIGSMDSMRDRTVTITGFSKTFSITGWRVGYTVAAKPLTDAIKKVHDFLTVGAPHPLQIACVEALKLPDSYYTQLRTDYAKKRNMLLSELEKIGFKCAKPSGAYFIWSDYSEIDSRSNDDDFARNLVKNIGVAAVPGSSFYSDVNDRKIRKIRFTFSKKMETLEAACRRLEALNKHSLKNPAAL
jgi:aspartate/methionine/tyrosine aminotransferase